MNKRVEAAINKAFREQTGTLGEIMELSAVVQELDAYAEEHNQFLRRISIIADFPKGCLPDEAYGRLETIFLNIRRFYARGCKTCSGTSWIMTSDPGGARQYEVSCPDCNDGVAELADDIDRSKCAQGSANLPLPAGAIGGCDACNGEGHTDKRGLATCKVCNGLGIVSRHQTTIKPDDLNRRVEVEQRLLDASSGKKPLPTAEECKALAYRLGVPDEFRDLPPEIFKDSTAALIDAAEAYTAEYEGDTRELIKTDVLNAFYAGSKWAAPSSHGKRGEL